MILFIWSWVISSRAKYCSGKLRWLEFVRARKEEWDDFRKDVELVGKHYNESVEKAKQLTTENNALKEKLRVAVEKLTSAEQRVAADLQQTSQVIQKLRTDISRVLQAK
jgi:regulator of replication initiation timing